ncbi:hypothetical protein KC19_5G107900 [Ceratodon purpureus]|uniref:Uncharacterized protein n=1 Tax=Ceratodon purpureus TaxID=3225 RepID=A0A8T0I1W4_CERPU|nr:hypothetical protein KC19_5G107900 [Ceratodon purpureus]
MYILILKLKLLAHILANSITETEIAGLSCVQLGLVWECFCLYQCLLWRFYTCRMC